MSQFTCAACGGVFESDRSDEEVTAEMKAVFGQSMRPEECESVCDDCYQKMCPDQHPEDVEKAVAWHARKRILRQP